MDIDDDTAIIRDTAQAPAGPDSTQNSSSTVPQQRNSKLQFNCSTAAQQQQRQQTTQQQYY
jgi:hypothetical protein